MRTSVYLVQQSSRQRPLSICSPGRICGFTWAARRAENHPGNIRGAGVGKGPGSCCAEWQEVTCAGGAQGRLDERVPSCPQSLNWSQGGQNYKLRKPIRYFWTKTKVLKFPMLKTTVPLICELDLTTTDTLWDTESKWQPGSRIIFE